MNSPLVSICIPTYNRAEILKNSLETLLCQKEFLNGKVEVVISDNASTDNTEEVCREFLSKYKGLKYYRNETNICDRNFPLALSRGTGVLRKLINDSYCYEEGALAYICEAAEKYKDTKPVLFFSNSSGANMFLENADLSEFLYNISFFMTWIGGFACWNTDCENIETENISYCDKNLWQVKKILSFFEKKDAKAVILNKLILKNHKIPNKNVSYKIFYVFHDNYLSIINEYVENGIIDQELYSWLEKDLLMNFLINWIFALKFNKKDYLFSRKENLQKAIKKAYRNKPYYDEFKKKCKACIKAYKGKPDFTEQVISITKKIIKKLICYDKLKKHLPWKKMKLDKHTLLQFIKFCIVGLTNTFMSYAIYVVALKFFDIFSIEYKYDYLVSTVIAFILSVFWSFIWNRIFVFKNKTEFWMPLLKSYISYSFTCLFLNSFLNWFWVEKIGMSKMIAPLINLTLTVPINFLLNKFWAFKNKKNVAG